jgi:ethanolamine transporter
MIRNSKDSFDRKNRRISSAVLSLLIAFGLWRAEEAMVRGFGLFGKFIIALVTVGLAAAIV